MKENKLRKGVSVVLMAALLLVNPATTQASCNHSWGDWMVFNDATCTTSGVKYRYCKKCFESQTVSIPATGKHLWTDWKADGNLCEDGKWTRYCTECYQVETKDRVGNGVHLWTEWKADGYLCEPGKWTRYCTKCDKEETKERPSDGSHLWSEWSIDKDSDCLNNGEKSRYCMNCYAREYEEIPKDANKHDWSNWSTAWSSAVEPTVFENGKQTRFCYVCSLIEEKEIPKLIATVKISHKNKTIKKGKSFKLKILKYTYTDYVASWKSSNKKIVKVDQNGKVTGVRKGKATVTLKMKSGCKAKCKIKVK